MYSSGVKKASVIIDMGIASGVLDFQNLDSSIHHYINDSLIFPYPERGLENTCALL